MRKWLILLLLCFGGRALAQSKVDSSVLLNPFGKVHLGLYDDFRRGASPTLSPDTSLAFQHNYDPTQTDYMRWQRAGAFGQATRPIEVGLPGFRWFDLGWHQYDPYVITVANVPVANARVPYSSLSAMLGGPTAVRVNGLLSRNITSRWNVTLGVRKMGTANVNNLTGLYTRQQADHSSYFASTNYRNKAGNYRLAAVGMLARSKVQINGGILQAADTFETSGVGTAASVLYQRTQNRLNRNELDVFQSYTFGARGDSTRNDSLNGTSFLLHLNASRQSYGFDLDRLDFVSLNFHPYDTVHGLRDTTSINSFNGDFALSSRYGSGRILGGVHVAHYSGLQSLHHTSFGQAGIFGSGAYKLAKTVEFLAEGALILTGQNEGDYHISGRVTTEVQQVHFLAKASIRTLSPTFIEQNYRSNFLPDPSRILAKQNLADMEVTAGYGTAGLTVYAGQGTQWVYWTANNERALTDVRMLRGTLFWETNRQRGFNTGFRYSIQSTSSYAVPVPVLNLAHGVWYAYRVRHVMPLRLGAEVRYGSTYRAYAFLPIVGQFTPQSSVMVKAYPTIDFYASAFLKKARFFVKLENALQGLSKTVSYTTPFYPLPNRTLRIGLNWQFFN